MGETGNGELVFNRYGTWGCYRTVRLKKWLKRYILCYEYFTPIKHMCAHTPPPRPVIPLLWLKWKSRRLSPEGNHYSVGQVQAQLRKVLTISQNIQPYQKTRASDLLRGVIWSAHLGPQKVASVPDWPSRMRNYGPELKAETKANKRMFFFPWGLETLVNSYIRL